MPIAMLSWRQSPSERLPSMRVALRPLLVEARSALADAGVASPDFDADELLASVLGIRRGMLFMTDDVTTVQADAFRNLIARRARREPLQHITGRAGFRGLELKVGKGVFIPRFETELVAGAAVDHARAVSNAVVVDLCAGSGAIALSVAAEVPDARVHAVERDPAAIYWLLQNAALRQGCGDTPIEVVQDDVGRCLAHLDGTVDVVVSNPPYVPTTVRSDLEAEVTTHDPGRAVFAGADGLELIPTVIETARRLLKPGGVLVMEHDDSHLSAVARLLEDWLDVQGHADLNGRPRYTTATTQFA